MTDESHEPYVATPANDPADEPLPGEGADDSDSGTHELETFGVPDPEAPEQPDYFSHDAPIEDTDIMSDGQEQPD